MALAAQGAHVAVHYRNSAGEAADVVAAIEGGGGTAAAFRADLLEPGACEGLVESVVARFGSLHVLVNNVGDFRSVDILDEDVAGLRAVVDANLFTAFGLAQAALPVLRRQDYGRVVMLGFAGGGRATVRHTGYAIAKQGLLVLVRSLALALGSEPVTVNMVSPGTVEGADARPPLASVPRGRWARRDEVAAAVLYLLSAQADYVTGQNLEVAGGWGM